MCPISFNIYDKDIFPEKLLPFIFEINFIKK